MASALEPLSSLLSSLETRLSAVESQLGVSGGAGAGAGGAPRAAASASSGDGDLRADVVAFDALRPSVVEPFLATARTLGGDAAVLADKVEEVFNLNRNFVLMASKCKKPAIAALRSLFQPTADVIKGTAALHDRGSDFANHQKAVGEGMSAFQWVIIEPAPVPLVEGFVDASEFWNNKVRTGNRGVKDHQDFATHFKALLVGLQAYVKEHHKTGLTWNGRGGDATAFGGSSPSASAPAPAAKPAPPKPATSAGGAGAGAGGGGGLSDVFSQLKKIDQSSGKTAGLRHVTKDMKSKGAPSKVPAATPSAPRAPKAAPAPTKPPRLELVKKRWFIEYQTSSDPIELNDVNTSQELYIYGCVGATIIIGAKVKAIAIDSCTRCQVIWESTVSAVEVVNCKRLKVQAKGNLPSIALDKTDGAVIYMSFAARSAQIVTSKCSELNVSYPEDDSEDATWVEKPIPEQFVSVVSPDGRVQTNVSDLYSG